MKTIQSRFFLFFTVLCSLFVTSMALAENASPLKMGIFPYASSGKLIAHNKDYKNYLEKSLARKIFIISARNVNEFAQRSENNEFDFVFTAPHHGSYLEKALGYQRIAMTKNKIQGYYLVKKDSSINSLEDIRDKKLALAPPITILHQMAVEQLRDLGMSENDNITFINSSSHNNTMYLLLNNKSDVSLTGIKLWLKLQSDLKDKLRVLAKTPAVPGFLIMAKKDLSKNLVTLLQQFTLDFNSTPAGQKYLFQGFKSIDDATTKELDAYSGVFTNIKKNN